MLPDLPKVRGIYKTQYNMAPLTWFKVGGKVEVLFKPEDKADLVSFLKHKNSNIDLNVIGAGSNIIIRDGGVQGVIVKLGRNFTDISLLPNGNLLVGAGCLNFNLAQFAATHAISGFEFLVGIPGTIGGGIAMNAGAYGAEFQDIVEIVHAVDMTGQEHLFRGQDMQFSYRKHNLNSSFIFTAVEFRSKIGSQKIILHKMKTINQQRSATQPITEKTGGSTFANPVGKSAWQLIDAVGLRGKKIGGASFSNKHCNFMMNDGTATANELEELGELAIAKVKEQFGIELRWEVKIIGRR